ncbi:hypothetical protein ACWDBO_44970 [Streptomyces mirabilis]|uniref:hypothetical protein n=1 Tax=Streptomyces mirabilis TaxID=68239 RepID=UPI0033207996
MSLLPRAIPATARQQLADSLAASGIRLGGIKPGTRVTLLAEHAGAAWELTYLGHGNVWRATGPGSEHGVGVFTQEAAGHITALVPEPEPAVFPGIPRTYAGVSIPHVIRRDWHSPLADGWRLGVRSAVAAR